MFNHGESEFNLTRILTGSEGSLAFICEAKLNLLPIPKYRTLINIKYNSFDAALRSAPFMLEAKALSVETVDSKVLNLAKQDIVWHSVSDLLTEDPANPILGINIVEYASSDQTQIETQVKALCQSLDQKMANNEAGIIGYQLTSDVNLSRKSTQCGKSRRPARQCQRLGKTDRLCRRHRCATGKPCRLHRGISSFIRSL